MPILSCGGKDPAQSQVMYMANQCEFNINLLFRQIIMFIFMDCWMIGLMDKCLPDSSAIRDKLMNVAVHTPVFSISQLPTCSSDL